MAADIKFLTIEDVSEMLQVTRTTVYNLKKQGLPFIKLERISALTRKKLLNGFVQTARTHLRQNNKVCGW